MERQIILTKEMNNNLVRLCKDIINKVTEILVMSKSGILINVMPPLKLSIYVDIFLKKKITASHQLASFISGSRSGMI